MSLRPCPTWRPMVALAEPRVIWAPMEGSQNVFLSCPIRETLYEGTRGPGKTICLLAKYAMYVGRGWGADWLGVIFRQTYKQLNDVVVKSRKLFAEVFPGAKFNESEMRWTFPDGEVLMFRYMSKPKDYWNYHGWEVPFVGWEELTNWPDLKCYDITKSINRSSRKGIPILYLSTANPWGVGHNAVKARFVDPAPAGVPIEDPKTRLLRVRIRGHWTENKVLLEAQPDYPKIIADSAQNPEQAKGWLLGDWNIVAGGMFDDLWDERVHVLQPFSIPKGWKVDRGFDWGSSKPFVVGWFAECTDDSFSVAPGRTCPRGSLFVIREWYGWDGKNPNVGIKMTDRMIGRGIADREKRMGHAVRPGPADASIFDLDAENKSTAATLASEGARFVASDKSRGSRKRGWQAIRTMLEAAALNDRESPHLYVFDTCRQFIRTVPTLPRSEKDPDDVDTDAEDHWGDTLRYRVVKPKRSAKAEPLML